MAPIPDLPPLPTAGDDPWLEDRNAFDEAVKDGLDFTREELEGRLSETELNAAFVEAMVDSTGRRLNSFRAISAEEAAALVSAGSLSSRLGPLGVDPLPPVTSDLPTVTWSGTATVNGRVESPFSKNVTHLGRKGVWDTTYNIARIGAMYSGKSFFLDGDTFEFGWRETSANGTRIHVFVDGAPITAAPYVMNSAGVPATSAGGTAFMKMVFGSSKRRRIDIYTAAMYGWVSLRVPVTATLTPTPEPPRIAIVGDSFCAGSAGSETLLAVAVLLGRLLGVDVVNASYGGTGYGKDNGGIANTFGSAGRVSTALERPVEAIVFIGSVNDTISGLAAAAAGTYAAYSAAAPDVPMIVFGVQPSNATDTISTSRAQTNDAIRQAALAAPSVIAFHDMVGLPTATAPSAYSSGTTYAAGDRATYQGSVWRVVSDFVGTFTNIAPGTSGRWELDTYMYTGTGTAGAPAGNGTRDVFLDTDGIHPRVAGSLALAQRIEVELRQDFAALAA